MKKMIYVSAYYNKNLGDDLFVHLLIQRYPNVKFCISGDPKNTRCFSVYPNVRLTSSFSWLLSKFLQRAHLSKSSMHDNRLLQKCDGVVKIGGSIFIEYDKWLSNWVDYEKPLFIIGANYGPARTSRFHDLVKDKISVACSCCFRDSYSYNQFKDLTNVHYAPDVLFAFDPYKYIHSMNNHRGLAISVINLSKRPSIKNLSDVYYESIAKLVDSQLHKQIPITLLSFCSNEGDSEAINKVLKLCHESKKVNVVEYKDDFKPLLQAIEMCDTIIATRFHAMVLGWIMNKHVIPIIYSPKQTQVISDINYNGPIFKIENIEGDLEKLIEECGKTRPRINELERIQEMALKQFFDFDEFVLREDI